MSDGLVLPVGADLTGQRAVEFGQKIAESIKFISAAFASGQVGALMGASIKLGFGNAVNYLWRGLNGTFAAAGQYLIEYFRTGIVMSNILTKSDFWKGMGKVIIGIFLDAIAFFQKGLAAALEAVRPLAEMIGQGDKVTAALATNASALQREWSAASCAWRFHRCFDRSRIEPTYPAVPAAQRQCQPVGQPPARCRLRRIRRKPCLRNSKG